MKITTIKENTVEIAVVSSNEILMTDVQSALDIMATVGDFSVYSSKSLKDFIYECNLKIKCTL